MPIALVALVMCASCASDQRRACGGPTTTCPTPTTAGVQSADPSDLYDTQWRLVEEEGAGKRVDPGAPVILQLEGNSRIAWNLCGGPSGRVDITATSLHTSNVSSTPLICPRGTDKPGYFSRLEVAISIAKAFGGIATTARWSLDKRGNVLRIAPENYPHSFVYERLSGTASR